GYGSARRCRRYNRQTLRPRGLPCERRGWTGACTGVGLIESVGETRMHHRRNLIIILAHGLRSDAIGDSRAWPLTTPYLEKLANHGVRCVATSACPADWGGMV